MPSSSRRIQTTPPGRFTTTLSRRLDVSRQGYKAWTHAGQQAIGFLASWFAGAPLAGTVRGCQSTRLQCRRRCCCMGRPTGGPGKIGAPGGGAKVGVPRLGKHRHQEVLALALLQTFPHFIPGPSRGRNLGRIAGRLGVRLVGSHWIVYHQDSTGARPSARTPWRYFSHARISLPRRRLRAAHMTAGLKLALHPAMAGWRRPRFEAAACWTVVPSPEALYLVQDSILEHTRDTFQRGRSL